MPKRHNPNKVHICIGTPYEIVITQDYHTIFSYLEYLDRSFDDEVNVVPDVF